MNLRNTTANQDRCLEAEFRALRNADIDPDVIESIFEDLDNSLSTTLSNAKDADAFASDRIKELETRIAELERDLAEAAD